MLRDARRMPSNTRLEADVCVVGAGPAGIAVTRQLERSGIRVCLVETGGPERDPAVQDLTGGESIGASYFRLADTAVMAFGGTSNHWYSEAGFRARPLDPIDFERRAAVPHSGWPFTRTDLDVHYERAHEFLGLGPYAYDLDDWKEHYGSGPLSLDEEAVRTVLFQVIPGAGVMHYLPELRRSAKTLVIHHAHAAELRTNAAGDGVTELHARTLTGGEVNVRADRYVLAAGGLGNPRLLLQSDGGNPAGLGNTHDWVGRCFMEHLGLRGATLELRNPAQLDEMQLYDGVEAETCTIQGKLSLPRQVLESEGLMNATFFLEHMTQPRTTQAVRSFVILRRALSWQPRPADLTKHLGLAFRGLKAIAETAYHESRSSHGRTAIQLKAMAEQAPNPSSRLMLGDRRDPIGLRRLRLDWQLTDHDRQSMIKTEELVGEELQRAGVGRLVGPLTSPDVTWQISGQWHHLGTTRMHVDPTRGVVDADARVHEMSNVWVTGGSVFPTGGYANPTLTIVALALRLADHLIDNHYPDGKTSSGALLS